MTDDIDYLIESMQVFKKNLQQKRYIEEKQTQTHEITEKSSVLLSLPKKILVTILLYLNFLNDIPNISETCKYLSNMTSSRLFQVLSYKITINKSKIISKNSFPIPEESKTQNIDMSNKTQSEIIIEIKKNKAVKDFLLKKISNQDNSIEDLNREISKLTDELRIQNSIKNKFLDKINKIEKLHESEKNSLIKVQQEIDNINLVMEKEMRELIFDHRTINKNKEELNKHNFILNVELNSLINKQKSYSCSFAMYEEAVFKIKDYYQTMIEPRVHQIISKFTQDNNF
jgi:hypothetical protein